MINHTFYFNKSLSIFTFLVVFFYLIFLVIPNICLIYYGYYSFRFTISMYAAKPFV